jgi:hypothetical protein
MGAVEPRLLKDLLRLREALHIGSSPYYGSWDFLRGAHQGQWRVPAKYLACRQSPLIPPAFLGAELRWQVEHGLLNETLLRTELARLRAALTPPCEEIRTLLRTPVDPMGHARIVKLIASAHLDAQPYGRFVWLAPDTCTLVHEALRTSYTGEYVGVNLVHEALQAWDQARQLTVFILGEAPCEVWQQPEWRQQVRSLMAYPKRALMLHVIQHAH